VFYATVVTSTRHVDHRRGVLQVTWPRWLALQTAPTSSNGYGQSVHSPNTLCLHPFFSSSNLHGTLPGMLISIMTPQQSHGLNLSIYSTAGSVSDSRCSTLSLCHQSYNNDCRSLESSSELPGWSNPRLVM
jgi:hypothetical protein